MYVGRGDESTSCTNLAVELITQCGTRRTVEGAGILYNCALDMTNNGDPAKGLELLQESQGIYEEHGEWEVNHLNTVTLSLAHKVT